MKKSLSLRGKVFLVVIIVFGNIFFFACTSKKVKKSELYLVTESFRNFGQKVNKNPTTLKRLFDLPSIFYKGNKEFSNTWHAKIPTVLQQEQQEDKIEFATYSGAGNVGDQNMAPDSNEDFLRPKSRRGRAKPIQPTGRYPWQKEEGN